MEEVKTPEEQAAVETPEKAVELEPVEKVETPEGTPTPEADQSVFNCTNCKGEGLVGAVGEEARCASCNGTGKV